MEEGAAAEQHSPAIIDIDHAALFCPHRAAIALGESVTVGLLVQWQGGEAGKENVEEY